MPKSRRDRVSLSARRTAQRSLPSEARWLAVRLLALALALDCPTWLCSLSVSELAEGGEPARSVAEHLLSGLHHRLFGLLPLRSSHMRRSHSILRLPSVVLIDLLDPVLVRHLL